ncbi:MAG TPA: hypothetical protein ENN56_00900 [Firmicutes bacterium]|nr:hypothetical protein [Bacillota bacterium]
MKGLLLEGIVAAGRSEIIRALRDHAAWRRRESTLILNDLFTERANEHLRSLTPESYRTLMLRNLRILQAAKQIESASPLFDPDDRRDLCYVLDGFHITNAIVHADGEFEAFADIDVELERLDCRLVLVMINEKVVGSRIKDVYRRRDERWRAYQERLESRVGDLSAYYVTLQHTYLDTLNKTALKNITIDTTDQDWRRCAEDIMRFWRI